MKKLINKIIAFVILECIMLSSFPAYIFADPAQTIEIVPVAAPLTEPYRKNIYPSEGCVFEYSGVILDIPAGAVDKPTEVTIEALAGVEPLPGALSNVTGGAAGYRFGPHGIQFKKEVKVSLPFSPDAAKSEAALSNLFTYFYNETAGKWERLKRLTIDRDNLKIVSATDHFTDMVNTTLQLPDLPRGVDFNLNSIKELKAASPTEGIPGIKGLDANNTGTAAFRVPIKIPAGRGAATPPLAISYNSDSYTGWLGRGFDIHIPRVTIDTRFGLPDYTEEDIFLLNGEELVLFQQSPGESLYRLRREGSFQRIRHITNSGVNYWEVTAKDGSMQYFGQGNGWLGPDPADRGNTFTWHLTRIVDTNGNTVDYEYQYSVIDKYTYLRRIVYSGHTSGTAGLYTISFIADPGGRPDKRIDSRGRFPSKMAERLGRIEICYDSDLVRAYSFNYSENIFEQSQLSSYSEEDNSGMDLNGDRYPDILNLPQDGGHGGTFAPGSNGGFSGIRGVTLPFNELTRYENLIYGFGASADSGGTGITFAMNDRAETYFSAIQQAETKGVGGIGGGVNGTLGQSVRKEGLIDINGDGLPDHINRDGTGDFFVQLNNGVTSSWIPLSWTGGMNEALSNWPLYSSSTGSIDCRSGGLEYSNTGSFGGNVSLEIGTATVSGGFNGSINKTAFRLDDINGDGLPDQVGKHEDEEFFRVRFNLGDRFSKTTTKLYRPDWKIDVENVLIEAVNHDLGEIGSNLEGLTLSETCLDVPVFNGYPSSGNEFEPAVNPMSVADTLDYSSGVSFNLGASLPISWDWFLLALVLTPGVNGSYATTSTSLQFRDLNGDGLPDHVLKLPGEEFIRVKENALGKTGLLKSIRFPEGGSIDLEYERKGNTTASPRSRYVLSSVSRNDGMDGTGPVDSIHTYTTAFSYNGGYYDRTERQFYGFRSVTKTFGDGSYKLTDYHNRDYTRKGLTDSERFYGPGGRLYTETVYSYSHRNSSGLNGRESVFQGLSGITSKYYGQAPEAYTESVQVFDYDSYGNINYLEDRGSTFTEEDDYTLTVTYADLPGYRHGYPEEMAVYDSNNRLLRRRWSDYYNEGNQKELRHYITENSYAAYTMTYDVYGNPRTMTGPEGIVREYIYDPVVNQYPVRIEVYNNVDKDYRYTSSMDWDYGQGINTASADQNENREEREYDSFGRLTSLITPYDTGVVPAVSFKYHTGKDVFPWYTVTKNKLRFDPADSRVMRTLTYTDGLGRLLMTAKEAETGYGSDRRTGWNCSGAIVYDNKGRQAATGQPVFQEGPDFPLLPEMVRPVRFTYDYLDRITKKLLPDNNTVSSSYLIEDHKYLTTVTDPMGNITEELKGLRDEIKAIRKKSATGKVLTSTSYTYDALTQLLEARDHRNNPVIFTYDLSGNRRTIESPDGGSQEFFYDSAGNIIRKLDSNMRARGQAINYKYDNFNRLVLVDYPRMKDTEYIYGSPTEDNNRAGRLLQRIDESGEVSFIYGLLGETTGMTKSLHRIAPLSEDKTAVFAYQVDYLGRMENIIYPDGETVIYNYDTGGQVRSITGTRNGLKTEYVREVGYNEQGQRVYIKLGNGTETHYTYDPERRWLDNLKTVNTYNQVYQDITFSFDTVGNVRGYANNAGKYTTIQDYNYDDLYQLTGATGHYEARPYGLADFNSTYKQEFFYDSIGNILSKNSEVSNNPAISRGQGLNYSLDYEYYPDKPHQAERIGDLWYRYDKNGNVIEEREGGHSPGNSIPEDVELRQEGNLFILDYGFGLIRDHEESEGGYVRKYLWDEENRLKRSTDAVMTVDYLYDSDGKRTAKYTDRGESLYFDAMWSMTEDRPNFRESKHIYLGAARIATKLKIEGDNSTGYERLNTYYYHSDHLGSAQLISDFEGMEYEHIEYTPYGELWIEEQADSFDKIPFRFTGKELDKENKLYYYGARYFNPQVSRWMSVDPAGIELLNPLSDRFSLSEGVNWYGYCRNNPVIYIDVNGLESQLNLFSFINFDFGADYYWESVRHLNNGNYGMWALNQVDFYCEAAYETLIVWVGLEFIFNKFIATGSTVPSSSTSQATNQLVNDAASAGGCFIAGTLIHAENGLLPIEVIQEGDFVYAFNEETGETTLKKVVRTLIHDKDEILIIQANDEKIETTEEHPFWVLEKGWVLAGDLTINDKLLLYDRTIVSIASIQRQKLDKAIKVYNFEVEDWHTYFVSESKITVHNKAAQTTMYFGKFKVPSTVFHRDIKPAILKQVDDFISTVGKNPDVKVLGNGKVMLTGTGDFAGKTLKTALDFIDFLD